jgi:hypothetical protein
MSNLIVEIVNGHDRPEERTFGERKVYKQKAYAYTDGAYPQEITLSFDSLSACLLVGKYELLPSSFKAGKYGDLEIDRFNMAFNKLDENQLKKVG